MRKFLLKGLEHIGRLSQLARFGSFLAFGGIGLYALLSERKKRDASIEEKDTDSAVNADTQQEQYS